jgi:hypothetical protein
MVNTHITMMNIKRFENFNQPMVVNHHQQSFLVLRTMGLGQINIVNSDYSLYIQFDNEHKYVLVFKMNICELFFIELKDTTKVTTEITSIVKWLFNMLIDRDLMKDVFDFKLYINGAKIDVPFTHQFSDDCSPVICKSTFSKMPRTFIPLNSSVFSELCIPEATSLHLPSLQTFSPIIQKPQLPSSILWAPRGLTK